MTTRTPESSFVRCSRRAGPRCSSADGADEGIRVVLEKRLDVLVSDIAMPKRDGYDLLRDLRARGVGPENLAAIAISAFARKEDRDRAFAAGYQAHFAKPIDARKIAAMIAVLARQKAG